MSRFILLVSLAPVLSGCSHAALRPADRVDPGLFTMWSHDVPPELGHERHRVSLSRVIFPMGQLLAVEVGEQVEGVFRPMVSADPYKPDAIEAKVVEAHGAAVARLLELCSEWRCHESPSITWREGAGTNAREIHVGTRSEPLDDILGYQVISNLDAGIEEAIRASLRDVTVISTEIVDGLVDNVVRQMAEFASAWVCRLNRSTGLMQWYNPDTHQWGGVCFPDLTAP